MINKVGKGGYRESGMAVLQLMLLLVMVVGLALPPLLSLMMTGAKVGQVEERKTKEFYSADAGISAALYRVKEGGDKLPEWMRYNTLGGSQWLESTYTHNPAYESYTLSSADPINDDSTVYRITPKWTLGEGTSMLETPNSTQKRDPAANIAVYGDYNGAGSVSGRASYKIDIVYPGGDGTVNISRIGCWLPPGLTYVAGSSSLEQTGTIAIQKVPVVSSYRGGYIVTWDYPTPVDYNLFMEGQQSKASVTFEYTPGSETQGEFSWVKTDKTSGVNYLAWDMKLKMYEVKSTATSPTGESTTVSAYTYMEVAQAFGSTMEGDYWAFGNTLMRDAGGSNPHRERLYLNSSSTVSAIPANATIKYIYLYWSGWKCKPWITGLSSYTPAQWTALCETYKMDKVNLKIAYPSTGAPLFTENITAYQKRGAYNLDHGGWSYSCFADITDQVKTAFAGTPGFVGNGKYTVGHYDTSTTASKTYRYRLYTWKDSHSSEVYTNYTPYPLGSPLDGDSEDSTPQHCEDASSQTRCDAWPLYDYETALEDNWAYAAWSIIIIYSSPSTSGHLLRIYDTFQYVGENGNIPITFAGFSTPPLAAENNAARYTHFVGEGDNAYNESVTVKGLTGSVYTLSDTDNPSNNVANNKCRIPPTTDPTYDPLNTTLTDGIDIDTFNIPKTCIQPGDTEAVVRFITQSDSMNLIYMILSFRSKFTPGGISIYKVE